MRNSRFFIRMGFLLAAVVLNAQAVTTPLKASTGNFLLSARDMLTDGFANITIQNKTGASLQVSALYINKLAYVSTADSNCDTATDLYTAGQTSGAYVTPITLQKNQTVQVGQNYLYNMLFSAIYYNNQQFTAPQIEPLYPSPCTLPGCTWSITDSTPIHWCIYIGVLSPGHGNAVSTASVSPFGYATHAADYNYDVVEHYSVIGPVTCNDQTLSCSVSSTQSQALP